MTDVTQRVMNDSQAELDPSTHESIVELCKMGDDLAEQDRHEEAISKFNEAWKIIPDPKNEWEASTWVLAAIADSCFFLRKLKSAREALEYAMSCPGGLGNPFLHLRLGQVCFEAGDLDIATDELMRAYMGGGSEIFSKEEPKYLEFLASRVKL